MVSCKTLQNGLRLIVNRTKEIKSVSMGIIVGTGAGYENDDEPGLSHLIEHMTFKGTRKRTARGILGEIDSIGAQVNAYTTRDTTCFYVKSTAEHAEEAFDVLADMFLNSQYADEQMASEKKVICEEINMTRDNPERAGCDLLFRAYYGDRGYGRDILGTKETVTALTRGQILAYRAEQYTAGNIVISISGNINVDRAAEIAEKYFSVLPAGNRKREVVSQTACTALLEERDIGQVHLSVSLPSVKRYDKLSIATQAACMILGGGMSSRLFQAMREKTSLAYSSYAYMNTFKDSGMLSVYAAVNPQNYERALETLTDCLRQFKSGYVTEAELSSAREQMISSVTYSRDSAESLMLTYGHELLNSGKVYDFDKRIEKIRSLTRADICGAIDGLFSGKTATSAVGPVKSPFILAL